MDSDNDLICDQDEVTGCQDDTLATTTQQPRMQATAIIRKRTTTAMAIAWRGLSTCARRQYKVAPIRNACNYNGQATEDNGSCSFPASGYDCSGVCLNDSDQDGICDEFEVEGCTDCDACNFNESATDNDGSCTFATSGYDCDGNCLLDSDNDQICDQDEVTGCQDEAACNYAATATDAGYCDYPETNYDCDGNCLNDSDQDGICDEFEVAGCTDSSACNYNADATDDDASCTYANAGYDCDW